MIHNCYTVTALGHEPVKCNAPTAGHAAAAYAREKFTQQPDQLTCAVHDDHAQLIGYYRAHFGVTVTMTPIAAPACHEVRS